MRATVIYGKDDVRVEQVSDPELSTGTDAIVRVVAACVCGSDLWRYRGLTGIHPGDRIGHEFVGIVESVGSDVARIRPGQFVIAPFYHCDMTCINCRNGFSTSCLHGGWWGQDDESGAFVDGGQGEYVRVPHADGTLVATPEVPPAALIPSLLTLSDVFCTGYHAALSGGVRKGSTVAVVGDGAVGLSAVLACKLLGASRVVSMSRHRTRADLAREYGASAIIPERGDEGVLRIKELFDGIGPDVMLECVGTKASMDQALRSARPGGMVGFVGVPNGGPELPVRTMFDTNVGVRGGVAPVRNYIEELLPKVWNRSINPGLVFDLEMPLDDIGEAYAAMDERRAIKVLVRP